MRTVSQAVLSACPSRGAAARITNFSSSAGGALTAAHHPLPGFFGRVVSPPPSRCRPWKGVIDPSSQPPCSPKRSSDLGVMRMPRPTLSWISEMLAASAATSWCRDTPQRVSRATSRWPHRREGRTAIRSTFSAPPRSGIFGGRAPSIRSATTRLPWRGFTSFLR